MTEDRSAEHEPDALPRKSPSWPRWLWIVAIVLTLLAVAGFIVVTALR